MEELMLPSLALSGTAASASAVRKSRTASWTSCGANGKKGKVSWLLVEGPGILRLNNRNPPLSPPCYGMFDAKIDPQKMGFLIAGLLKIAKPRLEIFNGDGFGIEKNKF